MNQSNDDREPDIIIEAHPSRDDEFGTVVLTAIADELGTDPQSLPPLRDSIDPEFLNGFLDAGEASVTTLSFEYHGYEVVVTSDGLIRLRSFA
ncbi:HalOD1 output domain-containing protein [Halosimplex sp. J119]